MARQIIIQERVNIPSDFSFRYVLWAAVPTARQSFYANPAFVTTVKDATTAEVAALQSGAVVELQQVGNYVAGTPIASIQADLINKFNAFQAQITATNPWQFYGTSWDGTAWNIKQTT
jgi:hypothetical protein